MTVTQYGSQRGPIDPLGFPPDFPGPKILVTGATGIGGSHIALALARSGYKVHATTRSKKRSEAFSRKWPAAGITWTIVTNQDTPGVYDEAIKGCEGVVHCAGPFDYKHEVSREILDPSVEGILNVFEAAVKEGTVRRVIHISSVAAIHQHPPTDDQDWSSVTYDETCYNLHEFKVATGEKNEDRQYAYTFSKKFAEEKAQEWLKNNPHNFDVVTFCPATQYGPLVQPLDNLSELDTASRRFYDYTTTATQYIPKDPYPTYTAVKDLAQIVVRAYQTPVASGQRYQVVSGYYNYGRLFSILRKAFPTEAHRFPDVPDDGLPLKPHFFTDSTKAERDFGVLHWTPIEEAIVPEFRDLLVVEAKS
ncbi:hypothetical protein BCR39DRAFT_548657 [Naematelia encephala]|uniref:NAD-dependent epimerase/dehydratase domain-containing protein n=1 Tax=Naematelia encephala TaxID=71784 RepID=A0A1Y2AMV7_9TREE|nr:hypothetical protein BCR39DRAFT_548657 [Naematelia encephala]